MKPVWAIVCGTLRDEVEFSLIIDRLLTWREEGMIEGIVFSTWKDELREKQALQEKLKLNDVKLVESLPNDSRVGTLKSNSINYWRQATQLQAALDVIPRGTVVLKTRTDRALPATQRLVEILSDATPLPKVSNATENFNLKNFPIEFGHQIAVLQARSSRIMQYTDYAFLGYHDDIEKLINFDVSEFYLSRDLVANTQFFIYPFFRDFPVIKDYFHLINFRPLIDDLENYTLHKGDKFPHFFERVYATFFQILLTHFRLLSLNPEKLGPTGQPIEFADFFKTGHSGHLVHDALGVSFNSKKILEDFVNQAGVENTLSTKNVLKLFSTFVPDNLQRATPKEVDELEAFQRDEAFSAHHWLRRTRVEVKATKSKYSVPMSFTFPGVSAEEQAEIWTACSKSSNVPNFLFEYWCKHQLTPIDTPVYLLSCAKAGNQYGILTLTRLLREHKLSDEVAKEVVRINNFRASMHRLHGTINVKVSCYILSYWAYVCQEQQEVSPELSKQVHAVLKRYLPGKAEAFMLASKESTKLELFFDEQLCKADDGEHQVRYRRLVELALELTKKRKYWDILNGLFTTKEPRNKANYEFAIRNSLLGVD